ncbi:MAG TPA: UbiX family flavin prenyltransferase [Candidatus Polarisedimenticolia bacterium]|nr:UbiX family flavin prenyltransferase [Candidatus Polarisedimenticolia bacterium]
MKRVVVGVTGASGALCARALLRALLAHRDVHEVHTVLSAFAIRTINAELGTNARDEVQGLEALLGPDLPSRRGKTAGSRAGNPGRGRRGAGRPVLHRSDAMEAPISSGSFLVDAMVIMPCSGGTLGAIASGHSSNLVQRAAEVTLKERRRLILGFRETPLSLVHIDAMRSTTRAGAIIMPLMPAFYTRPRTLDDVVAQITARVLDLLGLEHTLGRRWEGVE